MAELILVLSESGSGKSTAIGRNEELNITGLNPKITGIVNIMGKPLPFKGWKKDYNKENKNYVETRDYDKIREVIRVFNDNKDIKNVVIDDFQYAMSGEFMDKANIKGFDKFTDIGKHVWDLINQLKNMRDDVKVFILAHSETYQENYQPKQKVKTIGKLIDEKIVLEGLFTIVLYAEGSVENGVVKKWFRTQSNGNDTCKSPYGMFSELIIPNDLGYVAEKIEEYYN